MFRKPKPEIKLDIEQLPGYLDQCFDGKMRQFEAEAERIVKSADEAKAQFISAYEQFENSSSAPDTEFAPMISASYVRGNKNAYVRALRAILGQHSHVAHSNNVYSKYYSEQAAIDNMINSVLKTNMQFNSVLIAYSTEMNSFKKSFSALERCNKNLKDELGYRTREIDEYKKVSENIGKLDAVVEEIRLIGSELEKLSGQGTEASKAAGKEEAMKKLESSMGELASMEKRRAYLEGSVASALLPLERAARKYEHSVGGRPKLTDYITRPMENIVDRSAYSELQGLVEKLYKEIETGSIGIKSTEPVGRSVELVRNGNILGWIDEIKLLDAKIHEVKEEMDELRRIGEEISSYEHSSMSKKEAEKALRFKEVNMIGERAKLVTLIQEQFAKYYNERISIGN